MRRGFTLMELLVVFGIIAVLAAVLLPVLFTTRQKSQQATCASNLRQIAAAFSMYAQDHDGVFPHAGQSNTIEDEWNFQIVPYVKTKKLECSLLILPDDLPSFLANRPFQGYAANGLIDTYADPLVQEGDIRYPSATVLLTETHCTVKQGKYGKETAYPITEIRPAVLSPSGAAAGIVVVGRQGAMRHSGGSNYAFVDGHVKWFRPEAVSGDDSFTPPADGTFPTFKL